MPVEGKVDDVIDHVASSEGPRNTDTTEGQCLRFKTDMAVAADTAASVMEALSVHTRTSSEFDDLDLTTLRNIHPI